MVLKKAIRLRLNRVLILIASGLFLILVLNNLPLVQIVTATTTRASSGIPSSLADDLKAEWLPSEDVTFVLQRDMNATFFFVEDDPKHGIDPVRSFLLRAETNIRSLFHHLLYRPGCEAREELEQWGNSCAEGDGKREQVVIDVGCNRGWYSLMAAAYGHRVYAFDPQPHCRTLLSASVLVNGFHDLVTFTHAFVTDKDGETMEVRRRTGCMGGFPNNNHAGYADTFRKPLDRLPGANDKVTVEGVSLDDVFDAGRHDVLLLKMDVEGFESHALASGKRLLEGGAVRNIILEFNLPMMSRQPEGLESMKDRSIKLVRQLVKDYGYKAKSSHKGSWKAQKEMTMQEWEQLFSKQGNTFVTIDAWFYK
ncbi:S-adenosyl-L-methionine-dependent methyltransferase [Gracilaria domingensis]|nr:S-adenosyl-L-methionine-dependent methyltransferase [Gracilaria domingensis]